MAHPVIKRKAYLYRSGETKPAFTWETSVSYDSPPLDVDALEKSLPMKWQSNHWRVMDDDVYGPASYTVYLADDHGFVHTYVATWRNLQVPLNAPAIPAREDLDSATASLVYGSIPRYRNSDRCPRPLCDQRGIFVQMALCCPTHGPFHPL